VTSKKAALIDVHNELREKVGATASISRGKTSMTVSFDYVKMP
jgi:hypothetical protein